MNNFKALPKYAGLLALLPMFFIISLNSRSSNFAKITFAQRVFDTDKFSITIPAGWTHSAHMSNGFKIFYMTAPVDHNFSPNMNILTEGLHGLSKQEYYEAAKQNMKNMNFVFNGEGDFDANNLKGSFFQVRSTIRAVRLVSKLIFL
ncbi:MAG TPA: hypothetical protein VGI43_08715 [Mucilaginibacter sp.]|jgi:hypothetical protein